MPNIKIRIEKEKDNSSSNAQDNQLVKNKEDNSNVAATTIFAQQMIQTAKQTVSFSISNVGNFYGDYIRQDTLQNQLDLLGNVSTVALGFASKGVVGGTIAIAGLLTKTIFNEISTQRSEKVAERNLELLRKRSGNSTINSSRGTEN